MTSLMTSSGNNAGNTQQFVDDVTPSRNSSHCEKTKRGDVPVSVDDVIATSVASPMNVWEQRSKACASRPPTFEEQLQAEEKEVAALRKQVLELKEKRRHQKRLLKMQKEKEQLLKQLEALNSNETDDDEKDDEFSSVPPTHVSQRSVLSSASRETPTPTPRGSDEVPWTNVGNNGKTVKSYPSNSQKRHQRRKKASSQEQNAAPAKGGFGYREQKLPTADKLARMLAEKARPEKKVDGVGVFSSVGTSALPNDLLSAMKNYKDVCPGELAKLLVDSLVRDESKGTCVRGFLNTDVARAALNAGCSTENVKVAVSRFAPASWRFLRDFLKEGNAPMSFFFSEACRNTLKKWCQRDWEEACDYLNNGQILLLGADGKPLSGKVVEGLLWSKDE